MSDSVRVLLAAIAIIAAIGFAGRADLADQVAQDANYCAMRQIWERDADRGVPASERSGWPDLDNGVECHAKKVRN